MSPPCTRLVSALLLMNSVCLAVNARHRHGAKHWDRSEGRISEGRTSEGRRSHFILIAFRSEIRPFRFQNADRQQAVPPALRNSVTPGSAARDDRPFG